MNNDKRVTGRREGCSAVRSKKMRPPQALKASSMNCPNCIKKMSNTSESISMTQPVFVQIFFQLLFYRKSIIRNTDAKFCERSNNRNREDRCDLLEVAYSVKIRIPLIGRALPKETAGRSFNN